MRSKNKFLIKLFTIIYKRWLIDGVTETPYTIKTILGWRTYVAQTVWGTRIVCSPIFWRFK